MLLIDNEYPVRLSDAVAASSYIPGIYSRMVPIGGRLTVDGAWLQRTPVTEAAALGATHVIAFVANPQGHLLAGTRGQRSLVPPAYTRILHPARTLPVRGFDFDEHRIKATFERGRAAAESFLRTHERWLATHY